MARALMPLLLMVGSACAKGSQLDGRGPDAAAIAPDAPNVGGMAGTDASAGEVLPIVTLVPPLMDAAPGPEAGPLMDAAPSSEPAVEIPPPPPPPPSITRVSPLSVNRGGKVDVEGRNLSPAPRVILGTVELVPSASSETDLSFEIPSDFHLETCHDALPLLISTAAGRSSATSLAVSDPGPTIADRPKQVTAGKGFTVKGCGFAVSRFELGGTVLSTSGNDNEVVVLLPRSQPTGAAKFVVMNPTGSIEWTLDVQPREPIVVEMDLATVAPDGVVRLAIDTPARSQIASVKVGASEVSVIDPMVARWDPPTGAGTDLLSIRLPHDAMAGSVGLTLSGPFGRSAPVAMSIVSPSPLTPPPAGGITFPPNKVGEKSYPLGITDPFSLDEPGATGGVGTWTGHWSYALAFNDPGSGLMCLGKGAVRGTERYCAAPPCGMDYPRGSPSCGTPFFAACHPIGGTFQVATSTNTVDVTIDRTSSQGTIETYSGGWVKPDGVTPAAADFEGHGQARLVLRSKSTGRQLTIVHGFNSGCNEPL